MSGAREQQPFSEFRHQGLLWLVNRVVFHPRGYALAFHFPDAADLEIAEPTGWSIMGDGSEVWMFSAAGDDECFAAVAAMFEALGAAAPSGDTTSTEHER